MIKTLFLFLSIYFILPLDSISQTDKYMVIVNKFCEEIKPDEFNNLAPNEIPVQLREFGNEMSIKYQFEVNEIMEYLQKEYPNKSDIELLSIYYKDFMIQAINNCPAYFDIIMIPYGECPKDNETLISIKNEVEQYMSEYPEMSDVELYNSTVNHISQFIFMNRELIEKDYQDGLANLEFEKDMISYLFHKSKHFLIISLSAQI